MLRPIKEYPKDKKIGGIHSLPITEDGSIIFVWDKNEKALTTVGGRVEEGEDLDSSLNRETVEEAGLELQDHRVPVASLYWDNTDTYTVFVMALVKKYVNMPEGFETTGRVVMNLETARQLILKLEGPGHRTELLNLAEQEISNLINHKTLEQLYRLKDKDENHFLYPNLMKDRFRITGRHTLIQDKYEEEIIEIESLGPSYSGGSIFVSSNDIQKLKV